MHKDVLALLFIPDGLVSFMISRFTQCRRVLVALSPALLQSQACYALVVFPVYMPLATWGRRTKVDHMIRADASGAVRTDDGHVRRSLQAGAVVKRQRSEVRSQ